MMYNSTTDKKISVSSAQAISQGISNDGGLFVPSEIVKYSTEKIKDMLPLSYNERAKIIIKDYLTDFTQEEINDCVDNAYTSEKFGDENPAPLVSIDDKDVKINMLELWHGPTCAFKDMALQILPHFLTKALKKTYEGKKAVILVATSGDTGKAALEGFKDVEGTEIMVFYPEKGVSPMQKHQMDTQAGKNVNVCAVKGNFDDAQTGVKVIFTTKEIIEKLESNNMLFSSANSINWGRLLPQIVYYFSSYCDMVNSGEIEFGQKVNFVVPTGNFGNILAAYYASVMGIPVNKFICASNLNKVLTDFINTGVYDKQREFYTTSSPSMDILVSSNLERLLYHLTGENDKEVKSYMESLKTEGVYTVSDDVKAKMKELYYGGFSDEEQTQDIIKNLFENSNYLCDTHTAVAVDVYKRYVAKTCDKTPSVIVSTASPYKFSQSVLEAIVDKSEIPNDEFDIVSKLNEVSKVDVPLPLSNLKGLEKRFDSVVEKENMSKYVMENLGI